jgi:Glu-tRNA(Gln) amidotransferase subunit E-like FAD-binding protein
MLSNIYIPELISDRALRYEKLGLGGDLAELIAKSEKAALFEKFLKKFKKVKPAFMAEILGSYGSDILRNYSGSDPFKIKEEHFEEIFDSLDKGKIAKESVKPLLADIALGKELNIERCCLISDEELEEQLKEIVKLNKNVTFNALVGIAMAELRGKAAGEKIVGILKKLAN